MNKKVFIDANYIISLIVNNDKWHKAATEIFDYVDKKEKITCMSVINESITLINKKIGLNASAKAYEIILDNFIILEENIDLYTESMNILIKYHKLSLTDSIIVELMKKNDIIEIISFDSDFDKVDGIIRTYNKNSILE